MSLFTDLITSINTIGEYCNNGNKSNPNISHFYKTEFFNEGWMLKLTIARLLEDDLEGKLSGVSANIRRAAKKGWMSEGRLSAAFTHEQCTHADAVLGDIVVDENTQWGVAISKNNPSTFVVLEAKLGSTLASGTTNAKNFNQAARNMACMALAMNKARVHENFKAHYYVILPRDSKHFKDTKKKVERAIGEIENEINNLSNSRHLLREELLTSEDLHMQLGKIIEREAITWDDIIDAIPVSADAGKTKDLIDFYHGALEANGLPKPRGASSHS